MKNAFNLLTPQEIVFGRGQVAQLNERAKKMGSRVLIVHGRSPGRLEQVFQSLTDLEIVQMQSIGKEPDLQTLVAAINEGKSLGIDLVLGIGGGSVMDSLLPAGIAANRKHAENAETQDRLDQVIGWIAEVFDTSTDRALLVFRQWIARSGLRGLASLGVTEEHITLTAHAAASSSSMKANPVVLPTEVIDAIIRKSL